MSLNVKHLRFYLCHFPELLNFPKLTSSIEVKYRRPVQTVSKMDKSIAVVKFIFLTRKDYNSHTK